MAIDTRAECIRICTMIDADTQADLDAAREALDEIEKRLVGTTKAPWYIQYTTTSDTIIQGGERHTDSCYLAMMGVDYEPNDREMSPRDYPEHEFDAELMANSRVDVERMAKALRIAVKRLEDWIAWALEGGPGGKRIQAGPLMFDLNDIVTALTGREPE